jgi:hypothetical protein
MNFELLPNEIVLDLFDYFDGTDLLRAFYGLNSRFNFLLYKQYRAYRFRFQYISKRNFDMICQEHLSIITDRVIALQLSDDTETPGQINLFVSYIPLLTQFTHLRSITLYNLRSYHMLLKILDECQHLCNLTRLKFSFFNFSDYLANPQLVVNKIWSLPKLNSCDFDININERRAFCLPTIISPSLKYLSMSGNDCKLNQINGLFKYTPHLKGLLTYIWEFNNDDFIPFPLPTLIKLKICFFSGCGIAKMIIFFENMPNLRQLYICIWSQLVNGHQWEQIIRNYLPKLKTFQLEMNGDASHDQNIEEEANKLLNSFRSSFWIDEHRWFVRCFTSKITIYLYTLSNVFNYNHSILLNYWQSTYPHDNQQEFYNKINHIYDPIFFDQPIVSNISLPNIKYLRMKLPINDQFWSIVPNLNQLEILSISSHVDNPQSQVQALLDRARHLVTLNIDQDKSLPLQMSLFKYTNTSVRKLDLEDYQHYFNEDECIALARSPLGVQCEVLTIRVNNSESIINLVKNMINLHGLTVKFADDKYHKRSLLTNHNDELVQWLKDNLPSAYLTVRYSHNENSVLIWI